MVVESWESVQGNLRSPLFRALADSMHKNIHHGGHGCLRVIGLKREESRVALSSDPCLEYYKCNFQLYTIQVSILFHRKEYQHRAFACDVTRTSRGVQSGPHCAYIRHPALPPYEAVFKNQMPSR